MISDILTTLAPHIAEILISGLFALGAYVVALLRRKIGVDLEVQFRALEAHHREALERALETAVVAAASRNDEQWTEALAYVHASVPDAIDALRPSTDILTAKLEAAAHRLRLFPSDADA